MVDFLTSLIIRSLYTISYMVCKFDQAKSAVPVTMGIA